MTTSLDAYLRGPYKEDSAFLSRLLNTMDEVVPIFYRETHEELLKQQKMTTWPYAVSVEQDRTLKQRGKVFSASTHCMILFALDALSLYGKDKHSILLGEGFRPCTLAGRVTDRKKLDEVIAAAKKSLLERLRVADETLVDSGTYGRHDPFTLTWLTELIFRWTEQLDAGKNGLEEVKTKLRAAVEDALKRKSILEAGEDFNEVPSSFLRVRRLHLANAAKRLGDQDFSARVQGLFEANEPNAWQEFDATIHRQLSYSAMEDPKFDPAELAFAFEGALLLHPNWVSPYTAGQVFQALKLSRDRHPFWRPLTPFLANERGHVLFLISIEVANSILRACEILNEDGAQPTPFSQFEPQVRTYATWLLGEVEELSDSNSKEANLLGWRTEYEDKRDTIQLWHTSHVLIFLSHYASLLKRKIAADGLDAAGLQLRQTRPIKGYWDDEPLRSLAKDDERPYAVLRRIKKHYIEPRQEPGEAAGAAKSESVRAPDGAKSTRLYSMLLYGPPGTGKTTVAEQLAATLKRPLIIITVSDFLAAGAAEIENRAKGVFQILGAQDDVIILFDEIDQFLLDRNSEFYRSQDDVFKFMTPGMLTKLQDLRDAENCIFIVATNYYERIDSAIKRRGRIDEHFLLSIPDREQRLRILERFTLKVFERELEDKTKRKVYEEAAQGGEPERAFFEDISKNREGEPEKRFGKIAFREAMEDKHILRETALFGWGDLKNLVESKLKVKPGMTIDSLADALAKATEKVDAAVSLDAYRSRFADRRNPFPIEEFFLLIYIAGEGDEKFSLLDERTINHVLRRIRKEHGADFELLKEKYSSEEAVSKKVGGLWVRLFAEQEKVGGETERDVSAPASGEAGILRRDARDTDK